MLEHDEVEVAFEAIHFHSAYGKIPVLADRSAQAQTAWCLTMDTWKLRTLGKLNSLAQYKFSLIDLEGRQADRAQAKAA